METMLGKFQADLGNVSGEIRSLQASQLPTQAVPCLCEAGHSRIMSWQPAESGNKCAQGAFTSTIPVLVDR